MNYQNVFTFLVAAILCISLITGCEDSTTEPGNSGTSTEAGHDQDGDHSHEEGGHDHADGDAGHDESSHDDEDGDAGHDESGHDQEDGDSGHDEAGHDGEHGDEDHGHEDGDGDQSHDEGAGDTEGVSDAEVELNEFTVFDGKIRMSAPGSWEDVEPANNIIEAEFKVPRANEEDANDGRMTFMAAGGGVQPNIDRWFGQFKAPEGGAIASDQSEIMVAERTVHIVDISGTFMESAGGPMGPKTDREKYRMLAAIIELSESTGYFIKFYGPAATVAANEESFMQMVQSAAIEE
ncbi:MAG: hypothetical protein AAF456_16520 [Planctomycetota bacterium]